MEKLISVVIPCRNERKSIAACLDAILNNSYKNIEILVIDGMSEDGTREVLQEYQNKYGQKVRTIDNPHKLTPYAFNLGVVNGQGFYVQIVGSRNILAPDYLQKMVQVLEKDPAIACVGGDYQHRHDTAKARFIAAAMESKFGVGPSNYRTMKQDCYVDTVGVPMYRKSIFDEIGLFDERLTRNQDDDFNFRVTSKGHKIFYCSSAVVLYYVRGTYTKLHNQFMQYGYFKVFVNKKHSAITTLRQLVPAIFLIFLLLSLPMFLLVPHYNFLFTFVIGLYLLLGFVTSMKFTNHWWETFAIQWAIFIMHIGYGRGYLKGIWDFLIHNRSPNSKMQQQTT